MSSGERDSALLLKRYRESLGGLGSHRNSMDSPDGDSNNNRNVAKLSDNHYSSITNAGVSLESCRLREDLRRNSDSCVLEHGRPLQSADSDNIFRPIPRKPIQMPQMPTHHNGLLTFLHQAQRQPTTHLASSNHLTHASISNIPAMSNNTVGMGNANDDNARNALLEEWLEVNRLLQAQQMLHAANATTEYSSIPGLESRRTSAPACLWTGPIMNNHNPQPAPIILHVSLK